ncbi:MAG: hypothetical protein GFH27_549289n218 [Chloroflexi bacterium AL-W]|nr:hypothetical protein [Chloroflexi bacterium AL-N1]NOK66951.1 hypothetical protein [Chloroflexi bacterium AL-N10]NOK74757.1 hypothetical protein [Chloroflexi bacterium AL-N5]NOK81553.1 hypothetical protein [Chloroflexi bacterium AL-W]NOK89023.1 hypothetical protein [Chloroflexi bacterium AL-N15]
MKSRSCIWGVSEGHVGRYGVVLLMAVIMALLFVPVTPVAASDEVNDLPPINNYASARFDTLTTVRVGDTEFIDEYGHGAEIAPDRYTVKWVAGDGSATFEYVQIGTVVYTNDGAGWERTDTPPPTESSEGSEGLSVTSILRIGDAVVRDVPTTHYQIWTTGNRWFQFTNQLAVPGDERSFLEQTTIKIDLWIGQADGFVHQNNFVVSFPEFEAEDGTIVLPTEVSTLTTYYNFNDSTISIEAPI